jgi:hypothetical protein
MVRPGGVVEGQIPQRPLPHQRRQALPPQPSRRPRTQLRAPRSCLRHRADDLHVHRRPRHPIRRCTRPARQPGRHHRRRETDSSALTRVTVRVPLGCPNRRGFSVKAGESRARRSPENPLPCSEIAGRAGNLGTACHAEGRGFESLQPLRKRPVFAGLFVAGRGGRTSCEANPRGVLAEPGARPVDSARDAAERRGDYALDDSQPGPAGRPLPTSSSGMGSPTS